MHPPEDQVGGVKPVPDRMRDVVAIIPGCGQRQHTVVIFRVPDMKSQGDVHIGKDKFGVPEVVVWAFHQ